MILLIKWLISVVLSVTIGLILLRKIEKYLLKSSVVTTNLVSCVDIILIVVLAIIFMKIFM